MMNSYFVIDEKNNTIDLTEKGREELAQGTRNGERLFYTARSWN